MVEKKNTISVYAAAVTKGQKKRLLAAYSEYISLVRTMEGLVAQHTISGLAAKQANLMFPNSPQIPWSLDDANKEEKEAYTNFIMRKQASNDKYCFVSFDVSSPNNTGEGILSTPKEYLAYTHCNTLPHYVERFVAAYKEESRLRDTTFIVNGKYILTYDFAPQDLTIAKALTDEVMVRRFQCIFEILGRMPQNLQNMDEKELRKIQNEVMASELTAPFENTILNALGTLTEESNRALKDMLCRKKGDNYLFQAENGGVIPSASRFQDYQNIRHLLHHQWDTLDNLGRFTFYDTDRNAAVRAKYLEGYGRLCNQNIQGRLKSYAAVAADFAPLVQGLSPELLIRQEGESHNKFLARLKAYKQANPEAEMLIETGYSETHNKKRTLIKSIERQFPNAEIIDRQEADMEQFLERMHQFMARKKFLDVFADIEYKICQNSLFSGNNQPVNQCWQDIIKNKTIAPEDVEKWNEFRKLRNELSHHHMDKEMAARLDENLIPFAEAAIKLNCTLLANHPKLFLIEGNIYRAEHKNGKVVEFDFKEKRVLNVITPSGRTHKQISLNELRQSNKKYIEEHANGTSFTLNGKNISAFRRKDGTLIDLNAKKITYPNFTTFYFNSEDHNSLVSKGGIKIITDKNFRVLNYICKRKSVTVSKNEVILLPNLSKLTIGAEKNIETAQWQDSFGKEQKVTYNGKEIPPTLRFNDGTTVKFTPTGAVISHKGIELSYHTRKAFADSYSDTPPPTINKSKNNTR